MLALEAEGQQIVLDLRDVTLVNEGAVKFLAGCEADGIKLENCPAYIRRATAHEDQRAGSMSVIEQNVAGADVAAPTETQSAKSRSRKLKYQTSS